MSDRFSRAANADGFVGKTYRVYRNGRLVGYVRQAAPGARNRRWERSVKNEPNISWVRQPAYANTRQKAGAMLQLDTPPVPAPEKDADGKTPVVNSCGHTYRYKIIRPDAVDWLKKQPCPNCRKQGDAPKPNPDDAPAPMPVPTPPAPPEPEPEPDTAWVSSVMDRLPKAALFHSVLPEVVLLLEAGVPVWLQGPPGTSKSTLVEQAADALGLAFHPTSCHELMTESKLFGYLDANGVEHRTPLWDAYENGGVFLLDEIDNGNPNLLAALNSALSNGHCVFGSGSVVQRHANFRVVATANTAGLGPEAGFIGRNGVDLATRDRFVTVQAPIDERLEDALAELYGGAQGMDDLIAAGRKRAERALNARSIARESLTSSDVTTAVRKVRRSVDSRFRGMVVSPRATIHTAAMVAAGFTLRESLSAKLPGLKDAEIKQVLTDAGL